MLKGVNTIQFIIISGVIVMAAGAWIMPMYSAQLNHDDAVTIQVKLAEAKTDATNVSNDVSNNGLQGNTDLATLMTASVDQSALQKSLGGENFNAFQDAFLSGQTVNTFGEINVLEFELPAVVSQSPNDLTGTAIKSQRDTSDCINNGVSFVGGAFSTNPLELTSFSVKAAFGNGDFDLAGGAGITTATVHVEICLDNSNVSISDEIALMDVNDVMSRTFEFGFIPPNEDILILIVDDEGTGNNATNDQVYRVWISTADLSTRSVFTHFDGLAGNETCDGFKIIVRDEAGALIGQDNAIVEIGHEFIPFFIEQSVDNNSEAIFRDIPTGSWFIDIFPLSATLFPEFAFSSCDDFGANGVIEAGDTVDVTLKDAGSLIGTDTGGITVNVVDENGTVVNNTQNFIDFEQGFIINNVCEDGIDNLGSGTSPTACPFLFEGEFLFSNDLTLTDTGGASDGTFTITGLPVGIWFVSSCDPNFACGFDQVLVTKDTTVTVEIEVFTGAGFFGTAFGGGI